MRWMDLCLRKVLEASGFIFVLAQVSNPIFFFFPQSVFIFHKMLLVYYEAASVNPDAAAPFRSSCSSPTASMRRIWTCYLSGYCLGTVFLCICVRVVLAHCAHCALRVIPRIHV